MHSTYVDGVTIRPLHRGETEVVQAIFDRLGPRSRALRFGGAKLRLSCAELEELTRMDGRRHALVAYADGAPIGIARLVRDGDVADVAVAVVDDWQRRRVGTILIEQLAADARAAGIKRLRASMRAENRAPLALMRHVTTIEESRYAGGELEVVGRAA
jgi:GNAT superfamily N-acetyltransferase